MEFYSFIDSAKGAELLARSLREFGAVRPINVFLEWGFKGGRTGVRSIETGREVINVAAAYRESLKLCGFSGFEGIADSASAVDEFHKGLEILSQSLSEWVGRERPIISFGRQRIPRSHMQLCAEREEQGRSRDPQRLLCNTRSWSIPAYERISCRASASEPQIAPIDAGA